MGVAKRFAADRYADADSRKSNLVNGLLTDRRQDTQGIRYFSMKPSFLASHHWIAAHFRIA
ncbi:MAG: hypothetical protein LBS03_01955 [Bacteroidales bacterium]|nr:hypothetical protein [Bacteroidales bacterium]